MDSFELILPYEVYENPKVFGQLLELSGEHLASART